MASLLSHQAVPNTPLYISTIINIKHKVRNWNIAGHSFDLEYTNINSQIRVHADYGTYDEAEKMWHVEFYVWSHYFPKEPFPFPFPTTTKPVLISVDNPAPPPVGPRPTHSTPVPNPFPPVYNPGPRTAPTKPAAHASLPPQFTFNIRGTASYNQAQGSTINFSQKASIGRAYNNRPTRGRRPSLESRVEPANSAHRGERESLESRIGPSSGAGFVASGAGVVKRDGRTAVQAARRQLKVARRTGGRT